MRSRKDAEEQQEAREFRRKWVYIAFLFLAALFTGFLAWKLRALFLPCVLGALLAYLFRPVKDRFQVPWLPHELRVLTIFAVAGLSLFMAVTKMRALIPDEKEKLEIKVRLKYKLNEKFQEIVGSNQSEKRSHAIARLVTQEAGPMMDQLNRFLDLDYEDQRLFAKYREGFNNQPPIGDRINEYFLANQTTSSYSTVVQREPTQAGSAADSHGSNPTASIHKKSLMEELSVWILLPLMFVFLGFDNGQMRKYFIGLVPNRYFELSLTVVDMLDDAIGKYLRGTLMECALVGLTLTLGLFLLGIPFGVALAIGAISGLANAIPFLGPAIGLVIALGYSLIAEGITPLIPGLNGNDLAIYVVALVAITHVLDNIVFQPIVLGSAVNLHPLVVILAIIGGSVMMGVWGMLLSIPAVVVLKTAVETLFKELKAYRII